MLFVVTCKAKVAFEKLGKAQFSTFARLRYDCKDCQEGRKEDFVY